MVDAAQVRLFGRTVGFVSWNARYGAARFEYDSDFVRSGLEPSPILMPAREGRVYGFGDLSRDTFRGLPGMLADSLPDTYGRALFDKWLALTGRTSGNPVESLCFMGKCCMGALEFEPALEGTFSGAWTSAHQMSVNGKFDNINRADLLELAARNNIRNASQIIDEICDSCSGWGRIARECEVPGVMIDAIVPYFNYLK